MNINLSSEGLQQASALLSAVKNGFPKAISLAVNRTLEGMKTDAVKETQEKYFAKPSDIRKTLTLKKTNQGNLVGMMISKGTRKTLADYQLTPKTPRKGSQILQGAVKRGGLKTLRDAFLVRRGGKYKPYVRNGSGKWNIQPLISPAIPQIMKNDKTVASLEVKATERFEKRLNHEVARMLNLIP